MKERFDRSEFYLIDKYDVLLAEYEERCREAEESGAAWDDCEFDPDKCKVELFGDLTRGEVFILEKYIGKDVNVVIPDGVSVIKKSAFAKNTKIKSIVMPDSVCEIEAYAFSGCTSLDSVRLSPNILQLDFDLFADCVALENIDLPDRLKRISIGAFKRSGLKEIFIPANVSSLSGDAFACCNGLERIDVDPENPYHYSRDNCVYHTKNKWLLLGLNDGVLPNDGSFTVIYDDAFKSNLRVRNVKVPNGVTWIGSSAFAECKNLESIDLPPSLETLGACVFTGCSALKKITIPARVKKIERFAFDNSGVQTVTIKRGVEELDENVFFNCKDLREVYVPDTVRSVSYNTFDNCNVAAKIYFEAEVLPEGWQEDFVKPDVILGYSSDVFD